jgi:CHAD domain-containing protein
MTDGAEKTGSISGIRLKAYTLDQFEVIDRALAQTRDDLPEGIHAARKAIRFIRAALDLGQASLGYDATLASKSLKVLCRDLAPMRDAHVVVNTLDSIAKNSRHIGRGKILQEVREHLIKQQTLSLGQLLEQDPNLSRLRARSCELRSTIASLPWAAIHDHDVETALAFSERRAKRAAKRVRSSPQGSRRHRWRRRLRHLRYQMMIVESALRWRTGKHSPASNHEANLHFERTLKLPITIAKLEKMTSKLGFECDLRALHLAIEDDSVIDDHDRHKAMKSVRHALRAAIERLGA